jgi:hypothetical protein
MAGLTRQCRAGETFRIGSATVRIVKTGRRATVNIIAPPDVLIEHRTLKDGDESGIRRGDPGAPERGRTATRQRGENADAENARAEEVA